MNGISVAEIRRRLTVGTTIYWTWNFRRGDVPREPRTVMKTQKNGVYFVCSCPPDGARHADHWFAWADSKGRNNVRFEATTTGFRLLEKDGGKHVSTYDWE